MYQCALIKIAAVVDAKLVASIDRILVDESFGLKSMKPAWIKITGLKKKAFPLIF